MNTETHREYLDILKEEIIPALGCTEPIAIAYAAATARKTLGHFPERLVVSCSGNIIKNVKAVIVPTTGDMRGIETSAILGALAGDAQQKLEVLDNVTPEDVDEVRSLLKDGICHVKLIEGQPGLHILVEEFWQNESALTEIRYAHTNIVRIEKNGETLFSKQADAQNTGGADRSLLNLKDILEFVDTVELDKIAPLMKRQIEYNRSIAEDGLEKPFGAGVGATIRKYYGNDVKARARFYAAAGSDARMGGCILPVMINSGSGNQGLTVSLPVAIYAEELGVTDEKKYRALALSNLVAIYQKNQLGKLSAYCGAVSAAAGAGAGIAYLYGSDRKVIGDTIINTLGNVSGIVCDGAKSSCAAKIASSVDAAIMGFLMARDGHRFCDGDGLVAADAEGTIRNVGRMGREGMRSTDVEILNIMLGA